MEIRIRRRGEACKQDENRLGKTAKNGKADTFRPLGRPPTVDATVGHQHHRGTGTLDEIQDIILSEGEEEETNNDPLRQERKQSDETADEIPDMLLEEEEEESDKVNSPVQMIRFQMNRSAAITDYNYRLQLSSARRHVTSKQIKLRAAQRPKLFSDK